MNKLRNGNTIVGNTVVHKLSDGGRLENSAVGYVYRGKTKFLVNQYTTYDADGNFVRMSTYLTGARGAMYELCQAYTEDDGTRIMRSVNSGGEYRVQGNRVKIIEIAGIIEFLN